MESASVGPSPASVVIPAHNEEASIGRLLEAVTGGTTPQPWEIVVVCNGCTDGTAQVAESFPGVHVVTTPVASKREALRLGDEVASGFPRVYVDADVVIDARSLERLVDALESGSVLAAGPSRHVPRNHAGWPVRWYYDVWERLPPVAEGLFGRGVIALSEQGNERIRALPPVMSDDLAFSEAFGSAERSVVREAVVVVHPPRTMRDLMRRRVRAVTGNAEADAEGLRGSSARTTWGDLARVVRREPSTAPKVAFFLGLTAFARLRARRAIRSGDYTTWLRDESSRS